MNIVFLRKSYQNTEHRTKRHIIGQHTKMKKITNVCTTVYEVITVEFDIPIILFELFACGGEFCEN